MQSRREVSIYVIEPWLWFDRAIGKETLDLIRDESDRDPFHAFGVRALEVESTVKAGHAPLNKI
jgi:hypothetical protein